jgi:hypothetical protein
LFLFRSRHSRGRDRKDGKRNYFAAVNCERGSTNDGKKDKRTKKPPSSSALFLLHFAPSPTTSVQQLSILISHHRLELIVRVTLVAASSRVDLGGDGSDSGLKSLALLVVVLSRGGGTELLEPFGGLLELSLNLLDVGTLELSTETLLVGELTLEGVDKLQ